MEVGDEPQSRPSYLATRNRCGPGRTVGLVHKVTTRAAASGTLLVPQGGAAEPMGYRTSDLLIPQWEEKREAGPSTFCPGKGWGAQDAEKNSASLPRLFSARCPETDCASGHELASGHLGTCRPSSCFRTGDQLATSRPHPTADLRCVAAASAVSLPP